MEPTRSRGAVDGGWPWNCARCGRTIYHDALVCAECDREERASTGPPSRGYVRSWVVWLRRQSYAGFLTRVSTIAAAELLLTAFWLQVLFAGATPVPA